MARSDEAMTLLRRAPVLAACRDGPTSRRQIAGATALSRTTAYRATTDLVERGLLRETGRGYVATPRGEALVAARDAFLTGVETVDRLEPLFELLDHPELVEHAHLLGDAEVVVADASNPYRVVDRAVERFEATARSRGTIASTTAVQALERVTPSVDDKESFERVFTASALDAHDTVSGDEFHEATESEALSVLVADDDAVPFSFAIDADAVTITGHDPATGLPTVHVESTNAAARAWLDGLYERCRERARPLKAV